MGVVIHLTLRALLGPLLDSAPTPLYLVLLTIVIAPLLIAELIVLRG
jgi:hypothetical protein